MTEKFKILSQYIKDMSSETADIEKLYNERFN